MVFGLCSLAEGATKIGARNGDGDTSRKNGSSHATHDGHAGVKALRDDFENRLLSELEGVRVNGSLAHRTVNTSHLSFESCEAAGLLILLDEYGVQCSAGSACMTGKQQPSHVQTAMGIAAAQAKSSLRISFSIFTTQQECAAAVEAVKKAVHKLRSVQGGPGVGPRAGFYVEGLCEEEGHFCPSAYCCALG